jgi:hypothetical protein
MNDELAGLPWWLLSPLAVVGAGLLLSLVIGVLMQSRGLPKLYGAVVAGLVLGVSGLGLVDAALATQFQELFNAASALVLFEVGRKMDLAWLWRSARQGGVLLRMPVARTRRMGCARGRRPRLGRGCVGRRHPDRRQSRRVHLDGVGLERQRRGHLCGRQ